MGLVTFELSGMCFPEAGKHGLELGDGGNILGVIIIVVTIVIVAGVVDVGVAVPHFFHHI